jgi:hypothetical protein
VGRLTCHLHPCGAGGSAGIMAGDDLFPLPSQAENSHDTDKVVEGVSGGKDVGGLVTVVGLFICATGLSG